MKKIICVVSVQIEVAALKNEENIKKSLSIMTDAVKENGSVDLFVLPEDFITGPIPNHTDTHCLNNDSAEIRIFRDFARQNKCYVVLGSFIKKIDNKLYNTTLVIDRFGETILEHKKTNLWLSERSYLSPGM
jgi:predicted amidohydrolase